MAHNSVIDDFYNHYLTICASTSYLFKYETLKRSSRGIFDSVFEFNKDVLLCNLDNCFAQRGVV